MTTNLLRSTGETSPPSSTTKAPSHESDSQPDSLGDTAFLRYRSRGRPQDLDSSIAAYHQALEVASKGPSDRLVQLNNFSAALDARFRLLGNPADIDHAIEVQQRLIDLTPENDPDKNVRLGNFGASMWSRYKRFGNPDDLEGALVAKRRAVELTSDQDPHKAHWLTNLGASLSSHFERYGDLSDVDEAIVMLQRAVELTSDDDTCLPDRLISLSVYLDSRFKRSGDASYSDRALEAIRRAVKLTPEGHPGEARLQGNLGAALWTRFERFGDPSDLENALVAKRRAVELTPDGHTNKPRWLGNLGASLICRFERFGNIIDLADAIEARRRAVQLTPEDSPEAPQRLAYLGIALQDRFLRFRDASDIDDAVEVARKAVELTPDDHTEKASFLAHLGVFLHNRFELSHDHADLENALAVQRRAVILTPDEHTQKPNRLSSLGTSLHDRFLHLRDVADLDDAVDAKRRAVQLALTGNPYEAGWQGNLGVSLRLRYEVSGNLVDLNDAIVAGRRAVDLTPQSHPDLARELKQLGDILYSCFKRERSQSNFQEALNCFMSTSTQRLGDHYIRREGAESSIWMLSQHPEFSTSESLIQAHSRIIDILPELVWLGHTVQRRFVESSRLKRLVHSAVGAAVSAGDLRKTVEWMEAGRSLVWSQVLAMRSPVDDLEEHHPDLAQAFHSMQLEIQGAGRNSASHQLIQADSHAAVGDAMHHYRILVTKYERLLDDIRRQTGFEYFLRPKGFQDITTAFGPDSGLIVLLNVDSSRCDALIIDGNSLRTVALPSLSEERAKQLQKRWWDCLQEEGVRERGMALQRAARRGTKENLQLVLERLWRWIVYPVLQALSLIRKEPESNLPHLTWCPTGPLMQLPLHAAGLYGPGASYQNPSPRAFNFVVSSYTPSLNALERCLRKEGRPYILAPRLLVVTQPETPNQSPLPCTLKEAAQLAEVFSGAEHSWMNHENATVAPVLAAMDQHEWIHFACHGSQRAEDPTLSAFELFDGPLTLSTLMNTVADNAELAFLSACQTATGNEDIPEESMHLAAGMLAVGFKGVVATMWSIADADAPVIVDAYYRELLKLRGSGTVRRGETGAAYALHEATGRLREKIGEDAFERWVPFVHFGA